MMKALVENNKSQLIGLNDFTGVPIREGDVLQTRGQMRFIVIWNEYINNYSIINVPCYNSMQREPQLREVFLEDDSPLKSIIIESWKLKIKTNIHTNPVELCDNEL